jgi:polysaccharide chain length determinant protein (PEP-CTERM system associated)
MASPAESGLGQITNFARMAWRFRWLALFMAGVFSALGWASVAVQTAKYEVATRVYLDTQSILRPLLKGLAVDSGAAAESARLLTQTLLVRPNLEAVARKTDMDLEVTTPAEFEALIDSLVERISVSGTKRSNIFKIAYYDSNPKQAYRVVEALLNIFVERSLGESRKDTSSTRQFIEEQIKDYETRLLLAEARLKEFKRQNVGLMPSDGRSYFQRLDQMKGDVSEATLSLNESQRRADSLIAQLKDVPKYFTGPAPPPLIVRPKQAEGPDPMQQRINAIQGQIDNMLLQYTDKHPDVVAAHTALEALEKERSSAPAAPEQAPPAEESEQPAAPTTPNPLYQELAISLGQSQAEVAALKERVSEYQRRQDDLRKLIDTVPKIEAELARLNRDYAVDKNNYDELVQRREALKISNEASQTTDEVRFNVIEPPREPLLPVSPNRILNSSVVLVVALGAGIGLALGMGLLKPAFYGREDCERVTQLPVLGVVSRVWTTRELFRRRMEVATFALGCFALLGIFGAVVATHVIYIDVFTEFDIADRLVNLKDRFL